jgi:hypothetical protein
LIAGVSAIVLGFSAMTGCGGGTEGPGGSGGSGATGGASSSSATGTGNTGNTGPGLQPPKPGDVKPADGATNVTFAVNKLYLGETKRDGTPDPAAWKTYGYDLDGKISTKGSTDLCKPRKNASPTNVYPDGNEGIDNSFGKNIVPIINGLQNNPSSKVNDSIAQGSFTVMLDMEKLGADPDYNPILVRLYGGAKLATAPLFDGSDIWPVVPELLNDPLDIKSAKVQFKESYLVGNTWVSGSQGDVALNLSISGYTLSLTIRGAYVTMDLDAAHQTAKNGTIAGVLGTDELIAELQKIAGQFDVGFCDPNNTTFKSITTQIEQASDILKDGTQKPDVTCDGISIGIGFDAVNVVLGDVAPASQPGPDPCAP